MSSVESQRASVEPIALPDAPINLCPPHEPCTARVVSTALCTAGGQKAAGIVRHIAFDVAGTPLAGAGHAGQAFGVVPPGKDDRGRPQHVRLYSYSSPTRGEDGNPHVIATCVKRVVDEHWKTHKLFEGVASNYLCDLAEGDKVKLTGPVGKRFLLPTNAGDYNYLFVATGTGIAPFRAMVLDLLDAGATRPIHLIAGAPYATDLIYEDLFRRLDQQHANFHYLTALSRQGQADGQGRLYVHDRLDTHADTFVPLLRDDRTLIYICGIAGMEIGVFRELAQHLPPTQLQRYVRIDEQVADHPDHWTHHMIHHEIMPTDRTLIEVYA